MDIKYNITNKVIEVPPIQVKKNECIPIYPSNKPIILVIAKILDIFYNTQEYFI